MGTLSFSGQVIKYVGTTNLAVSNTVLSSTSNINRIFGAESGTDVGPVIYQPGLPEFLQGFTNFAPGCAYMCFPANYAAFPLTYNSISAFKPPIPKP